METKEKGKKERVIVYIDGFNLYFGMKSAGYDKSKWLDLHLLACNLLKDYQQLIEVKYFTSRVSNNPEKQKRQLTFIEALETKDVKIIYGNYQRGKLECRRCGNVWESYNEKMTDVNIASQMLIDAFQDRFDAAILISGDSDLVPPIKAIHSLFSQKKVIVAFPPDRHNASVALIASSSFIIGRKKIYDSQLPDEVMKKDGFILRKPKDWL